MIIYFRQNTANVPAKLLKEYDKEGVRMCIIPVDQKLIRSYRKKGVRLHRLDERKMKGK